MLYCESIVNFSPEIKDVAYKALDLAINPTTEPELISEITRSLFKWIEENNPEIPFKD